MTIDLFNYIESALWFVCAGLVLGYLLLKSPEPKTIFSVLFITFILFGASDIVEARTGAWWRPFWLLSWKAACICSFLYCFYKIKKVERHSS